jgi:anti-sigma-K factor RskA
MTCAELRELAPLYGLGALSPAERRAVEQHLAERIAHEGCEDAVRQAVEAAALLGQALPPLAPPEHVWAAIAQGVDAEPQSSRRTQAGPRWDFAGLVRGRGAFLGVALVLLVAVGLKILQEISDRHRNALMSVHLTQTDEALRGCLGELLAAKHQMQAQQLAIDLLERPATEVVSLAVQGGEAYRANVILNQPEKKAVVVAGALKEQKDHDYELWIIRGQEKIAAGLLHGDENGRAIAEVDSTLLTSGVDAFAVTLEPSGGGSTPRGPIVLVGKVKKG